MWRQAAAGTAAAKPAPRIAVAIAAPSVRGSIDLRGARIDDVVLTKYRETEAPNSPDVQLLAPRASKQPYYVQYGWSAAPGEHATLPGDDTVWTASGKTLAPDAPVTLSWDNGAGLTFHIAFTIDDNYMFGVTQSVTNATGAAVKLFPWMRVRRDYTPAAVRRLHPVRGADRHRPRPVAGDGLPEGQEQRQGQARQRRLRSHRRKAAGPASPTNTGSPR